MSALKKDIPTDFSSGKNTTTTPPVSNQNIPATNRFIITPDTNRFIITPETSQNSGKVEKEVIKNLINKQITQKSIAIAKKAIPYIGAGFSLDEAIDRYKQGDTNGILAQIGSAAASFIPYAGPFLVAGMQGGMIARDVYFEYFKKYPENDPDVKENMRIITDAMNEIDIPKAIMRSVIDTAKGVADTLNPFSTTQKEDSSVTKGKEVSDTTEGRIEPSDPNSEITNGNNIDTTEGKIEPSDPSTIVTNGNTIDTTEGKIEPSVPSTIVDTPTISNITEKEYDSIVDNSLKNNIDLNNYTEASNRAGSIVTSDNQINNTARQRDNVTKTDTKNLQNVYNPTVGFMEAPSNKLDIINFSELVKNIVEEEYRLANQNDKNLITNETLNNITNEFGKSSENSLDEKSREQKSNEEISSILTSSVEDISKSDEVTKIESLSVLPKESELSKLLRESRQQFDINKNTSADTTSSISQGSIVTEIPDINMLDQYALNRRPQSPPSNILSPPPSSFAPPRPKVDPGIAPFFPRPGPTKPPAPAPTKPVPVPTPSPAPTPSNKPNPILDKISKGISSLTKLFPETVSPSSPISRNNKGRRRRDTDIDIPENISLEEKEILPKYQPEPYLQKSLPAVTVYSEISGDPNVQAQRSYNKYKQEADRINSINYKERKASQEVDPPDQPIVEDRFYNIPNNFRMPEPKYVPPSPAIGIH